MTLEYTFKPYNQIGECVFGMERKKIIEVLGEPLSTKPYGYPLANGFLDDYGFFYILSNSNGLFEAIEIFPEYTDNIIILDCYGKKIELSNDIEKTVAALKSITDDLLEDSEGYNSNKLGLGLFCFDNCVENVIIYTQNYYD